MVLVINAADPENFTKGKRSQIGDRYGCKADDPVPFFEFDLAMHGQPKHTALSQWCECLRDQLIGTP